ncbi:uncharacterized protein LOC143186284 [Calliopsis andreniformis]|uniref:uncharacterized protein LOC143186284 n=1 Tax=Calliopsis andreniformis TaxID=337506 RepID=UPI003FCD0B91
MSASVWHCIDRKSNVASTLAILRYQESKRVCCTHTFSPPSTSIGNQQQDSRYQSPIRKPKENCDLRKCKYAKSHAENEFCNTQRLLDKIQYLKKSIQDLETTQKRSVQKSCRKKDALCQTENLTVTDLCGAREALSTCVTEMTKLKAFLDDDNCWWRIFKKREFTCCEQKSPHLHGYLDGTMVTLRMLEDTLGSDCNIATSTPIKSNSLELVSTKTEPEQKRKYIDQCTNTPGGEMKRYVDSSIDPRRSSEFGSKAPKSCQQNCPISCIHNSHTPTIPGSSKKTEDERSPGDAEPRDKSPIGMDPRVSSVVQFPKELFYTKSSVDFGSRSSRPKYTFSSENTADRRILAADMSTSMDILTNPPFNDAAVATVGPSNVMEKSFSLSPSRMFGRNRNSKNKKREISNIRITLMAFEKLPSFKKSMEETTIEWTRRG